MKEATPEQIVAFLTGRRTKDVEAEVVLEQLRVQWEVAKREAEAEIKALRAEVERCRMFRIKLWDALRELADLVKDEA
jgi:hypothetical protein